MTLDHLISSDPAMVMLIGDLTYADDHMLNDTSIVDLADWWEGAPRTTACDLARSALCTRPAARPRRRRATRHHFLQTFNEMH